MTSVKQTIAVAVMAIKDLAIIFIVVFIVCLLEFFRVNVWVTTFVHPY